MLVIHLFAELHTVGLHIVNAYWLLTIAYFIFHLCTEGTTTNGDFLLPFKTGAFLAKAPVLPVILRYPYQRFSPAWDSISGVSFLICKVLGAFGFGEVAECISHYPLTTSLSIKSWGILLYTYLYFEWFNESLVWSRTGCQWCYWQRVMDCIVVVMCLSVYLFFCSILECYF